MNVLITFFYRQIRGPAKGRMTGSVCARDDDRYPLAIIFVCQILRKLDESF